MTRKEWSAIFLPDAPRRRTLRRAAAWLLPACLAACALTAARLGRAAEAPPSPDEIVARQCLVIPPVGRYGRSAGHTDAIEALIVDGRWSAPKAGDTLPLPDGTVRTWEAVTAQADGAFHHPALEGGYAYWPVPSGASRVMLLEATGHSMVYVNGAPRVGDPYGSGTVRLPVLLHRGVNQMLFYCTRGTLQARVAAPKSPLLLDTRDSTLPDLRAGETEPAWGAVVVINATEKPAAGLALTASRAQAAPRRTALPTIPPLSTRKVAFLLPGGRPPATSNCAVHLRLSQAQGGRPAGIDAALLTLRVRRPGQTYKRTFRSAIDGSVQYYAVNPAHPLEKNAPPPALVLTLHGAGVEAIGQADAYESKAWATLVAPTNRRPYGFDWEDWGRLDALEVLDRAARALRTDPRRTYLTGHSMGGHGVWQIGATFPDRFAAIGPSAGWISFSSYARARRQTKETDPTPVQQMLERAAAPSDTLALAHNYATEGVYILHGSADDNVPVQEARFMDRFLAGFHHDFVYHEQPGAGHWWDVSPEPGADCVDWPPLFDFLAGHDLPADDGVRQVDFVTACPGVSAWSHWACIAAQTHALQPSSLSVRYDPGLRRFVGTTSNVARLAFRLRRVMPGEPLTVELDGQKIEHIPWPRNMPLLWLARTGTHWAVIPAPPASLKGPLRYGPFKDAFRNRMLFVYGTRGSRAENAWAFAKARYDAETFWYRGNGSVDVTADTAFDPSREPDRNVILYGNAETNAAWHPLLAGSPVQVDRGRVRVGDHVEAGDDLACLFLRPRPGSDRACVGVVAGSGLRGMRLTDRLPYFVSGVGYPDCTVIGPEMLTQGSAGIRGAGFFGLDWSVSVGEFAWRAAPNTGKAGKR